MFECSMQRFLLSTRNDIQIPFLKLSEKQYCTAGVYQSSTRARNNTNTRYSPLEAVGINPRLERETMDNTRMSLEWFTTRRSLAEWAFNASKECLILEDRAVECSASATLPLSGTVAMVQLTSKFTKKHL